MDIMILIMAIFFAGFILICGYFEYCEKRGYNAPFDEDKT